MRYLVDVELSHLPVFPKFVPDENYVRDKCELLRLKDYCEQLKTLQRAARKWFKDNGITEFRGLEPYRTRKENNKETVAIAIPYYRYSVQLQGELEPIGLDKSKFRIETQVGNRIRVQYTPGLYRKLCAEILVVKRKIERLATSVRVRELSYLEHFPYESVFEVNGVRFTKNITTDKEVFYLAPEVAKEFLERNPNAQILQKTNNNPVVMQQ